MAGGRPILIVAKSGVDENYCTFISPQHLSSYQYYSVRDAKANDVKSSCTIGAIHNLRHRIGGGGGFAKSDLK